jgi:hypothetical protein
VNIQHLRLIYIHKYFSDTPSNLISCLPVVREIMKHTREIAFALFCASVWIVWPAQSDAEQWETCQDQIKECFAKASDSRERCLHSSIEHSRCSGTPLGALVDKRTHFASIKQWDDPQGPAFLGPQMIDKRCVDKFDTAWSAALVKGALSPEAIESLSRDLDSCSVSETNQLPRP